MTHLNEVRSSQMRKFVSIFIACFALALSVSAQESPRVSMYGGYSYLNADFSTSRQSFNGFEIAPAVNITSLFAVEGDFGGYYKSNIESTGLNAHAYTFMGGPRFNFRRVFAHALIGGDQVTGSLTAFGLNVSDSENAFAAAFGGGIQQPFMQHFAIRAGADYMLTRHVDAVQNNVRVSTGIVYTFGR
jgi:outer membrane immunogenic protein